MQYPRYLPIKEKLLMYVYMYEYIYIADCRETTSKPEDEFVENDPNM